MQGNVLHPGSASLRQMLPGMIDQNHPHNLGRESVEVRAIVPAGAPLVQQLQAEFIYQRSCLQITPTSLSPHKGGSDLAQMRVDQGDQFLERAWFPRLPPGQQQGDFARKRFQASLQLSILSGTSLASR